MYKQTKEERLKHLRTNILVHSCIYYKLHKTVISDDKWQELANELRDLQEVFTEDIGWYDREFDDWNGDTGMHLMFDSWVISKSSYVIQLDKTMKEKKKKEDKYFYY